MEPEIKDDRWAKKDKHKTTKSQRELMDKLARARIICHDKNKTELEEAAAAVLEFLPHSPILAVIFSKIYKLSPDTIEEIKKVFNVTRRISDN